MPKSSDAPRRVLFAAGVIQRRSYLPDDQYVPLRDRTWDPDSETFTQPRRTGVDE